jgi:DNA-binding beta-propeller fold protein YncE
MSIDAHTRKILRTIPLRGRPDAVVPAGGSVWVADGRSGVLAQIRPGYGTLLRRIRFPRVAATRAPAERLQAPRTTLAATPGAVWLTNRSRTVFRIRAATGEVERIDAGARVDAIAAGAGAVWALAPRAASVLRLDPARGRITDRVPIAARRGPDLPAPTAIAAGSNSVWVLNGNSATVTRINPDSRGVEMTAELGIDRLPADIAAQGDVAWIANFDGSLARLDSRSPKPRSVWVGGSLERVAATPSAVWTTTTVLDQKLPGGSQ